MSAVRVSLSRVSLSFVSVVNNNKKTNITKANYINVMYQQIKLLSGKKFVLSKAKVVYVSGWRKGGTG